MPKVIIYLREQELSALHHLAQREYRVPKAQAALIIRTELEKLGLIQGKQTAATQQTESWTPATDGPLPGG